MTLEQYIRDNHEMLQLASVVRARCGYINIRLERITMQAESVIAAQCGYDGYEPIGITRNYIATQANSNYVAEELQVIHPGDMSYSTVWTRPKPLAEQLYLAMSGKEWYELDPDQQKRLTNELLDIIKSYK